MGLRIKTNIVALQAQRHLDKTTTATDKSVQRLASGYRINKAADDAAGLAVSETLRAKTRSISQAKRNASDGVSMLQVAEGSMSEMSNILIRLRELSIQAASDTIGNRERSFANREYDELVREIDRIGNVTEFNGVHLLRAENEDSDDPMNVVSIHVGVGDASQPNTDAIEVDLLKMRLRAVEDLGLHDEAEIGPIQPSDPFDRQTASNKLTILDTALHRVNDIRSTLGAKQSRLASTISNLSIAHENASATNSRIRDVDFAAETATFTQNRILQQSGASVLSQANSMPELALSLLR